MHPNGEKELSKNDILAVLGNPSQLNLLVHDNH